MPASYPLSTATFGNKVNLVDIIDASHVNTVQDEIIATQSILGVQPNLSTTPSPSGTFTATATSFANVSARLANIETGVVSDAHTQYIRKTGDTANVIAVAANTTKGLVIRAAASQSASLQEWQTSVGSPVTIINASGAMTTIAPDSSGYVRTIHVSTGTPTVSDGNNGDVWLKYT